MEVESDGKLMGRTCRLPFTGRRDLICFMGTFVVDGTSSTVEVEEKSGEVRLTHCISGGIT